MIPPPDRVQQWPIFSYIDWPENHHKLPESKDWLQYNEIPKGSHINLSVGQLVEFLENETRNPHFKIYREEAVWIREYLWNQEKHFSNKDWRNSMGNFYDLIFQS